MRAHVRIDSSVGRLIMDADNHMYVKYFATAKI